MKVVVSLSLILVLLFAASSSFAQEKKPPRQPHKITQDEPNTSETIQLVHKFVQGRRFESQDARNVSFTLKPTRAFITIEF
jgi:hypothetical protein